MKRRIFRLATLVVLAIATLLQQSCATMLKGRSEEVMVSSDPSGAQVSINDQMNGTTPYATTVKSSEPLHIHVSKPGYQPQDITDDTSFRWGYEIWSFLCYVIPLGVDLADGAAWGHDQTMIAAHLEPLPQTDQAPVGAAQPTPAVAPAVAGQAITSQSSASAPPDSSAQPAQHMPATGQ